MKAKIAYLTSPAPNRFVLHFQPEGEQALLHVEISKGHLAQIMMTASGFAWGEQNSVINRVIDPQTENVHERAGT